MNMEQVPSIPTWEGRPVSAVIDLDAIAGNVAAVRAHIGAAVELMAVVKANGYGHGAIPVAETAIAAGASQLAVATVDEGAELRAAGIAVPILVFGAIGRNERPRAAGLGLSLVVANAGFARALANDSRAALLKNPVPVHLKVDTGMNRFGAHPEDVVAIAKVIAADDRLSLAGLMTHFASADAESPDSMRQQATVFDQVVTELAAAGIEIPIQHVANSAATLRFPEQHRGMVRLGIAMYGLVPDPTVPLLTGMRPALTVQGHLTRVFRLEPGQAVGYGGTYRSQHPERAGLVSIGYADGYRRGFSSTGWMSIRGRRADVIGRVSMDQCVVRIPSGLDVMPGEPVIVIGDGTEFTAGAPTMDELAPLAGTIGYEIATGIASRLPRRYLRHGNVVAVNDLAGYRPLP